MKKRALVSALVLVAGLTFYATAASAQTGPDMMGGGYGYYGMGPGMMRGYGGGYGPWCGQYGGPYGGYGMGPGMMGGGYGYGMGPGMMGRGYGMGPGMMGRGYGMGSGMRGQGYGYYGPRSGYGPQSQLPEEPLTKEEATQQVEEYLRSTRNPNLKVGEVHEKGNDFEADIVTKDGSLVDKLLVNRDTGWMRPAY